MGLLCLDKPVLPPSTFHRAHVADITQPYPSNIPLSVHNSGTT